jgi:hypothetical protein
MKQISRIGLHRARTEPTSTPPEDRKDEGQEEAQEETGGKRKVKGEGAFAEIDVTGEPADPRDLLENGHSDPREDEDHAEKDKGTGVFVHRFSPVPLY